MMGAVLRKIGNDSINCILVGPSWPKPRKALLHHLPVRKAVLLPHLQDLFIPGPHVPEAKAAQRHPGYDVLAWYILW